MASADNAQTTPFWLNIAKFVDRRIRDHLQIQPKNVPVHVTKVDKEFVYVAPDIQSDTYTFPTIKVAQTFSKNAREPTQVGDKGYIIAADYYLGGETDFAGGQANLFPRANLTPIAFQPISSSKFSSRNYNQYTVDGGPQGIAIRSADGKTTYINIDDAGKITITDSTNNGQTITLDPGNTKITVDPGSTSNIVYLGGDGVHGSYALVSTIAGPSVNVMARIS